jgi:hypothetical protein
MEIAAVIVVLAALVADRFMADCSRLLVISG